MSPAVTQRCRGDRGVGDKEDRAGVVETVGCQTDMIDTLAPTVLRILYDTDIHSWNIIHLCIEWQQCLPLRVWTRKCPIRSNAY
jgi:hypothetical protein